MAMIAEMEEGVNRVYNRLNMAKENIMQKKRMMVLRKVQQEAEYLYEWNKGKKKQQPTVFITNLLLKVFGGEHKSLVCACAYMAS